MATEISQLYAKISAELLDQSGLVEVRYVDGMTRELYATAHLPIKLENPFVFDPSPFLPDDGQMDLQHFKTISAQIIAYAQEREGVVESERAKLVQEYQPEHFYSYGDEVITIRVLKREPANMDRKGTGRPQRASGYAYSINLPAQPNSVVIVESRPIDHKIEFAVWAKTSLLADRRALWLERLFITQKGMFIVQGVEQMFWEGRGTDEVFKHGEQPLHVRRLTFFVRLREHEVYAYPAFREFEFSTSIIP